MCEEGGIVPAPLKVLSNYLPLLFLRLEKGKEGKKGILENGLGEGCLPWASGSPENSESQVSRSRTTVGGGKAE